MQAIISMPFKKVIVSNKPGICYDLKATKETIADGSFYDISKLQGSFCDFLVDVNVSLSL